MIRRNAATGKTGARLRADRTADPRVRPFSSCCRRTATRPASSSLDDVVRFCLPFIFAGLGCRSFEAYAEIHARRRDGAGRRHRRRTGRKKVARGVRNRKKRGSDPLRLRPANARRDAALSEAQIPHRPLRRLRRRVALPQYERPDGFPGLQPQRFEVRKAGARPVPSMDSLGSALDEIRRQDVLCTIPTTAFRAISRCCGKRR